MSSMIMVLDNYDSFTYNLVQYLLELGEKVEVFRNDEITLDGISNLSPNYIVISPGPCTPKDAGISVSVVERFKGRIPILGVCLGHQSICQAFGAKIVKADELMHGKTSRIDHDGKTVFAGLESPFTATRYHSLIAKRDTIPDELEITATVMGEDTVMGVRHKEYPIEGMQFHPESILTTDGKKLLGNFLRHYS